jgi:hypothetical protein
MQCVSEGSDEEKGHEKQEDSTTRKRLEIEKDQTQHPTLIHMPPSVRFSFSHVTMALSTILVIVKGLKREEPH